MQQALLTAVNKDHRRCVISRSGARIIMGDEEAALLRGGEAEPNLSGKPRPTKPCVANPVRAAHAEFIAAVAEHPPLPIPVDADPIDLEDRAEHLEKVLRALSVYVAVILDDTAQNVPGGLDLRDVEAILADLGSDVTGAIQHAADGMSGRIA
jgi:hypothetical protein